jgi:hypothetical protein
MNSKNNFNGRNNIRKKLNNTIEYKALRKTLSSNIVVEDLVFQKLKNEFKENKEYDLFEKFTKETSIKFKEENLNIFSEIERLNRICNNKKKENKKLKFKYSLLNRQNIEFYRKKINKKLFELNLKLLKYKIPKKIKYDAKVKIITKNYENLELRFSYLKEMLKKEIPDKKIFIDVLVNIKRNDFFYELNKYFYENPNKILNKLVNIQKNQNKFMIGYKNYFSQFNKKIHLNKKFPEELFFSQN